MPARDKGPHPARWRIAEAMNDLNPGASVACYRLIARMASGGMAEVWRARGEDDRAAPDVVLKVMLPALAAEAAFVAMFDEAVRLAAAVTHPNVVRLLAHGTWSGRRFLVLEPGTSAVAWRTAGQATAELSSSTEVIHGSRTAEG